MEPSLISGRTLRRRGWRLTHPQMERKNGGDHTHRHASTHRINFFQINLHHSKTATATLCQQLAEGKADITLIQQPWLYKGQIRGLTNTGGTVYSVAPENNARSCIYIRSHINGLPLLEFCSKDTTTVRITYTYGGGWAELIVASAYLPYDADEPPPTKEMRIIIDYCHSRKK
jgi:hypothetical protein